MKMIFTLAGLTVKEYYRRKLLIVILLMMVVVAGTGLLVNPFTLGVQGRLLRDIALLFIQLFSIFFSLALSSTAIPNEIERKLLYPFLARPISRGKYLWGKLAAISLLLGLGDLILGLELVIIVFFSTTSWHWMILGACFLTWLESVVVSAFSIWFSTIMTAPVTFAAVLLLYVIGSLSHVYSQTLTTGNSVMSWFLPHLKSLVPYFDYFSIRSAVTHNHPVSFSYFTATLLYGVLYVLLAMLLAEATFAWRDL